MRKKVSSNLEGQARVFTEVIKYFVPDVDEKLLEKTVNEGIIEFGKSLKNSEGKITITSSIKLLILSVESVLKKNEVVPLGYVHLVAAVFTQAVYLEIFREVILSDKQIRKDIREEGKGK